MHSVAPTSARSVYTHFDTHFPCRIDLARPKIDTASAAPTEAAARPRGQRVITFD